MAVFFSKRVMYPYLIWLAFGFFHGLHWLNFIPGIINTNRHYGKFSKTAIWCHIVAYWFSVICFFIFRQTMQPWYIPCAGGESMSVHCLFSEQRPDYVAFYIIHLIFLAYIVIKWIVDGVLLYYWINVSDAIAKRRDDDVEQIKDSKTAIIQS